MRRDGKGEAMKETMQHDQQKIVNENTAAEECKIFYGKTPDGKTHIVGISALKVVIVKDGCNWFAQGLDVDYAAEGISVENAKQNFENGLVATIHQHLKAYNEPSKMLKPAPPEVWQEMFYAPLTGLNVSNAIHNKYYQLSVHSLEGNDAFKKFTLFKSIEYYIEIEAAAAA
jgi:hypothetical protein